MRHFRRKRINFPPGASHIFHVFPQSTRTTCNKHTIQWPMKIDFLKCHNTALHSRTHALFISGLSNQLHIHLQKGPSSSPSNTHKINKWTHKKRIRIIYEQFSEIDDQIRPLRDGSFSLPRARHIAVRRSSCARSSLSIVRPRNDLVDIYGRLSLLVVVVVVRSTAQVPGSRAVRVGDRGNSSGLRFPSDTWNLAWMCEKVVFDRYWVFVCVFFCCCEWFGWN